MSSNHIICGWYTPDYERWADRLRRNLDDLGEPHDFALVPKSPGGWERNTMRKPSQAARALRQNPGKVVIFLDVDCQLTRPIPDFDGMSADVSVHMRFRTTLKARSGTMILNQTSACRKFLSEWSQLSLDAPAGTIDQQTLVKALFRVSGIAVANLDVAYCAVPQDRLVNPVVLHDSASLTTTKIPSWRRKLHRLIGAQPIRAEN